MDKNTNPAAVFLTDDQLNKEIARRRIAAIKEEHENRVEISKLISDNYLVFKRLAKLLNKLDFPEEDEVGAHCEVDFWIHQEDWYYNTVQNGNGKYIWD